MGETSANTLKAVIESTAGISVKARRDQVAPSEAMPYVTIDERIAFNPDTGSSTYDKDVPPDFVELLQVNLWQAWRNTADNSSTKVEDRTLARKIIAALRGRRLYVSPTSDGTINGARTWGVKVLHANRMVEEDENIVHDAITVQIMQELY